MSALEKLEQRLRSELARELQLVDAENTGDGETVEIGLLFDELLALLVDVALGLLDNCLANNPLARIVESILGNGIFERYLIRKGVRASEIPRRDRRTAERILQAVLDQADERDEVESLLQEINLRRVDWSLF